MTNLSVQHEVDVCRWALGVDFPNQVTSSGGRYQFKDDGQFYDTLPMKDLKNFQKADSGVPVGDGIMPVRGIFEALAAMKYPGFVDLEYEIHPDNPMPGVIGSFAYMRGVLAGMGYSARA